MEPKHKYYFLENIYESKIFDYRNDILYLYLYRQPTLS